MKTYTRLIASLVIALGLIVLWMPKPASAQALIRLDSEFHGSKEGGSVYTYVPALAGGTQIWSKTLVVPSGYNTAYVTISTEGEDFFGVALQLECLVDNYVCSPDFSGGEFDAPAGWITPLKHFFYDTEYFLPDGTPAYAGDLLGGTGDMHDNSINHTWCFNVKPGTHTFSIKMGNSCGQYLTPYCGDEDATPYVVMENINFYIDASASSTGQCTAARGFVPPPLIVIDGQSAIR